MVLRKGSTVLDGRYANGWYFEGGKVKREVKVNQEADLKLQLKSAYYQCLVTTVTIVYYTYYPSLGISVINSVTEITTYENCIPIDSEAGLGGYTGSTVKISSNLKPFVKSSTLNQTQLDKLSLAFDQFKIKNCATLALYNKLLGSGVSFNFSIDKTIPGYASYDPSDKSIKFKSEDFITQENVYEELIHAWQDKIYPGGVSQFQKYPYIGLSNIEFEPRMLTGVMENLIGFTVRSIGESFDKLVFQIADYYKQNGKFPSQLSIAQETLYFKTIDEMKAQIPAYNKPTNTNLKPNAVFDILNGAANCSPIE